MDPVPTEHRPESNGVLEAVLGLVGLGIVVIAVRRSVRVARTAWSRLVASFRFRRRAVRDADQQDRARRARGAQGEIKVDRALKELIVDYPDFFYHGKVEDDLRDGRHVDLDHVIVAYGYIIAIDTKAQRPSPAHRDQLDNTAHRVSRTHFGRKPQYRIVVHPNSTEPIAYDEHHHVAWMGLPKLGNYIGELAAGRHQDRLVAWRSFQGEPASDGKMTVARPNAASARVQRRRTGPFARTADAMRRRRR